MSFLIDFNLFIMFFFCNLFCRSDNYEGQEPLVHSEHRGSGGLSYEIQVKSSLEHF